MPPPLLLEIRDVVVALRLKYVPLFHCIDSCVSHGGYKVHYASLGEKSDRRALEQNVLGDDAPNAERPMRDLSLSVPDGKRHSDGTEAQVRNSTQGFNLYVSHRGYQVSDASKGKMGERGAPGQRVVGLGAIAEKMVRVSRTIPRVVMSYLGLAGPGSSPYKR